jgi:hypothetical protein
MGSELKGYHKLLTRDQKTYKYKELNGLAKGKPTL